MNPGLLIAGVLAAWCGIPTLRGPRAAALPPTDPPARVARFRPHSGATAAVAPTPAAPAAEPHVDPWLAQDKARHFSLSFAATGMAYGAARFALDREPARIAAGGVALALGVGKEIFDARHGRWFSLKDLAWDIAGVALGLTLVSHTR